MDPAPGHRHERRRGFQRRAALMVKAGWDAVGVTLQLRSCDGYLLASHAPAMRRRHHPGPGRGERTQHSPYVLDCRETFLDRVMRPAWAAEQGRTPGPCLHCNRESVRLPGREYRAHWRRAHRHRPLCPCPGVGDDVHLLRGVDRAKDQSYFLSDLSPQQVARLELPLGALFAQGARPGQGWASSPMSATRARTSAWQWKASAPESPAPALMEPSPRQLHRMPPAITRPHEFPHYLLASARASASSTRRPGPM